MLVLLFPKYAGITHRWALPGLSKEDWEKHRAFYLCYSQKLTMDPLGPLPLTLALDWLSRSIPIDKRWNDLDRIHLAYSLFLPGVKAQEEE